MSGEKFRCSSTETRNENFNDEQKASLVRKVKQYLRTKCTKAMTCSANDVNNRKIEKFPKSSFENLARTK